MKPFTELKTTCSLRSHAQMMQLHTLNDLHQATPSRQATLTFSQQNIHIDFSNQNIQKETIDLLVALAHERHLQEKIQGLIQGERVNQSENRPALHTALRTQSAQPIWVNGQDVLPLIINARNTMRDMSERIRKGQWLGFSGKPIRDIVNIGIGGSDLGPRFCLQALTHYTARHLNYHFISDVDPDAFSSAVATLNPETTLFIVSSKSFTTQETLYNAQKAMRWIGQDNRIDNHFIAVTANSKNAQEFGIVHILPIWDWIGGRYSATSAINFITFIAIGEAAFTALLQGASTMDQHFATAPFHANLPVMLALIGIWNTNFLSIHHLLILTYSKYLEYFVPYIQQLDMESNGKSIDNQGRAVNHNTGPIVWGGLGNRAQHSYYQLLSQGTHKVTLDFITLKTHENELIYEMAMAKKRALTEGINDYHDPNGYIPGNTPLNHISLTDCTPHTIGELIALYEHKIYVQSVIWNINPFDQPGVDSSKRHVQANRGVLGKLHKDACKASAVDKSLRG